MVGLADCHGPGEGDDADDEGDEDDA